MTVYLPHDAGEKSLWGETATENPVSEVLRDNLQADVVIIGGGFTGMSTALHLAEKGVSVALLEALSIGYGGSGRNAGLVNAGVWKTPDYVLSQLGEEAGTRFNQALYDSPDVVFDLVDRHQIDCQASRCGTINIAHKASAMNYLQDRCDQFEKLGASVRLIDGDTARSMSGSAYYSHGGILDSSAGTIQPLSYVRGLARAAMEEGARLFQESPLISLERDEKGWLAKSNNGQVLAEKVVIATNAYSNSDSQGVQNSTVPAFIFQCATAPLPDKIAESIIPQRQGLWDTQVLMTSSRVDAAGRLVMSSAGSLQGIKRRIRQGWMKHIRNKIYPQTRGLPWDYFWTGQVGLTRNKILRVQLLAPGVFAPSGYNGRGIGPGTVIGKHLAETLISGNRNEFPFPVEALYKERWRKARSAYYEYGTLGLNLVNRF